MFKWLGGVAALLAAFLAGVPASAQSYPQRPVRLIVPFPPGGSTDVSARILAQELSTRLGQPVVSENRPGAGTMIANDLVARATPDGYTLLFASSSMAITPHLNRSVTFDPRRDLVPISLFIEAPLIVVAGQGAPFRTLPELITHARANPGRLNVAYPGMGTTNHLAAALFNRSAKLDIVLAPYAGNAAGLTALMRNDVQLAFDSVASASSLLQDNSLRALAVTGEQRSPSLPDVPTVAESGVPGFETTFWFGLMAPPRTPTAIVERLATEVQAATRDPEVIARLRTLGFETSARGPQPFVARIAADYEKWGTLVRDAQIGVN
ncbi:Bug family tripartite tricarboxylate transporter substrate binding protein [Muricoccus radiodurans]|uniref:Bug family tripartite tricarboxylate transporter substrate binding protein n=1 Tax=Muricoccus radiodurans TaxID=2231721 RepID=UPI003CF7342E